MKNKFSVQSLLCLLVLTVGSLCARAQMGFDTFKTTRTYVLSAPVNILPGTAFLTNGPIDTLNIGGIGKIDFQCTTNSGVTGGTISATLYGSPDQTNLTALANYAVVTNTFAEVITNGIYGGTLGCTNNVLLPGTVTAPVAATAGWSTPYIAYLPFTNSAAINLLTSKSQEVGVNLKSCPRYLYVVYAIAGSATNFTVSAQVNAATSY